jgi:hypothetical protein
MAQVMRSVGVFMVLIGSTTAICLLFFAAH